MYSRHGGKNELVFGVFGKESGSFLKKRTKKLLLLRAVATPTPQPAGAKVFLLLFFQKKKPLLPLPCSHAGRRPAAKVFTLRRRKLFYNNPVTLR
jgi:hypothetical protein